MLVRVAIYEVATGEILRITRCPDVAVEAQAGESEAVIAVEAGVSDATHHVVNGEVVPL